jgi:CRISPR-associated protein Csm1
MAEIEERTLQAALAGLLHDIGKFAQRAGVLPGKHAEVGGEVVKTYVPAQWREFLYPVMGHHDKPLTGLANKVVALADRLSAGERAEEKEEQPRQLLSVFCRLQTKIGNDKGESKILRAPEPVYWPLRELALQREVIFPGKAWQTLDVNNAYKELWDRFSKKLQTLRDAHATDGQLEVYLESILLLLQQYTWCIPSAYYRAQPDVSLYDHSRTTAALAAVLHGMHEAKVEQLLQALEEWYEARRRAEQEKRDPETVPPPQVLEETGVALLVGGDISGVQEFIYTITSQGAASALRGRSFYLQLLTEVLARHVLRALGLPICNLIYQGGGGFYLLARANDKDTLERIRSQISEILWQHHRGDLYLALAAVPLKAADFYGGRISEKWEELARELRRIKQRRFAEMTQLEKVFWPQEDGGNRDKQCSVCGREHPGTEETDREGGVHKCPPCLSYEELGKDLRQARYMWLHVRDMAKLDENTPPGGWQDVLAAFGFEAGVTEKVPRPGVQPRVVLALDDQATQQLAPDRNTAVGRRFLVNVTPLIKQRDLEGYRDQLREDLKGLEEDDVKPFSLLEAQSRGIHRLGVLRMDLDDGGKLFSDGFVEYDDKGAVVQRFATLSRVAALSFAISLFFEGWVEFLAQKMNQETREDPNPPYRGDTLYSIYSGGDDLFFVGAWDRVVELARRVRADLTPFAAGHPGIHASAGVVLVGGKYPLYQAARDAGDAEDAAKRYERRVNGSKHPKDALNFLGQTVSWSLFGLAQPLVEEMTTVSGLAQLLERLIRPPEKDGKGVPAALLRILMRTQEQHDEAAKKRRMCGRDLNRQGEEQTLWGPWMWRSYYMLKRMAKRQKGRGGAEIEALAEQLKGENFRAIEWIGLAARWTELLMRM